MHTSALGEQIRSRITVSQDIGALAAETAPADDGRILRWLHEAHVWDAEHVHPINPVESVGWCKPAVWIEARRVQEERPNVQIVFFEYKRSEQTPR